MKAAEEFSNAPTPHVAVFGKLTGQVEWHYDRHEDLWHAIHLIEEIVGARAATNPDKVDKVLLKSRQATISIEGTSRMLLDECDSEGIITPSDMKARLEAISNAIARRRAALGIKGRGYFFD